ncbi:MAG: hypothetical protein LBD16_08170 [Oscillospiraceae bacterium]|jgi:hypothetical protein|nr:hypothetical protein [Oscillospiraceae bacterium]
MFSFHMGQSEDGRGESAARPNAAAPRTRDAVPAGDGSTAPNPQYNIDDFCCPQGTHFSAELNRCVPDAVPPQMRCTCPPHMHYNARIDACVYDELSSGVCPQGMKSDGSGGCVRNPIPVCPKGFRYDEKVDGCVKDVSCYCYDECRNQGTYRPPEPCAPQAVPQYRSAAPAAETAQTVDVTEAVVMPQSIQIDYTKAAPVGVCPAGYAYVPSIGVCVLEAYLAEHMKK